VFATYFSLGTYYHAQICRTCSIYYEVFEVGSCCNSLVWSVFKLSIWIGPQSEVRLTTCSFTLMQYKTTNSGERHKNIIAVFAGQNSCRKQVTSYTEVVRIIIWLFKQPPSSNASCFEFLLKLGFPWAIIRFGNAKIGPRLNSFHVEVIYCKIKLGPNILFGIEFHLFYTTWSRSRHLER